MDSHCLMTLNVHFSPYHGHYFTVDSTRIQKAVSMVHECGNHCKFEKSVILNTVEREQVADTKLVFLHDWTQLLYCLNVYCVCKNLYCVL